MSSNNDRVSADRAAKDKKDRVELFDKVFVALLNSNFTQGPDQVAEMAITFTDAAWAQRKKIRGNV